METVARVGGGALPLHELPSFACAVEESLAAPHREPEPAVVVAEASDDSEDAETRVEEHA